VSPDCYINGFSLESLTNLHSCWSQ